MKKSMSLNVGDKVYDIMYGDGIVSNVGKHDSINGNIINVRFEEDPSDHTFTHNYDIFGYEVHDNNMVNENRTLFKLDSKGTVLNCLSNLNALCEIDDCAIEDKRNYCVLLNETLEGFSYSDTAKRYLKQFSIKLRPDTIDKIEVGYKYEYILSLENIVIKSHNDNDDIVIERKRK